MFSIKSCMLSLREKHATLIWNEEKSACFEAVLYSVISVILRVLLYLNSTSRAHTAGVSRWPEKLNLGHRSNIYSVRYANLDQPVILTGVCSENIWSAGVNLEISAVRSASGHNWGTSFYSILSILCASGFALRHGFVSDFSSDVVGCFSVLSLEPAIIF